MKATIMKDSVCWTSKETINLGQNVNQADAKVLFFSGSIICIISIKIEINHQSINHNINIDINNDINIDIESRCYK